VTTPSPQDRLAGALSTVPDACREVLAWVERCKLRRRGDRLVLVLEVDEHGRVEALELPKRFTAPISGAPKAR
jgi:hypothetical protein